MTELLSYDVQRIVPGNGLEFAFSAFPHSF
jgi:hypothetical protein